jgi:gliding motility-associated-like protein
MKKILLLSLLLLSITTDKLFAQSCFNVSAGMDTTISCLVNCFNLKARVPDVRTSETYQVVSIPYTPYAYVTPGGTTDPLVNIDDHFSDSFFLPFPFCFYGNIYNKICVGSNGVITFDVRSNAKTIESFIFGPANTLPYPFGSPNNAGFYAPRASIWLAFYDMDPSTSTDDHKIEWRVEGAVPCRRFVVSYFNIGYFGAGPASCDTLPENLCTMQAVLYEGTGIIDVFYKNKPACLNSLAIAGVQNWGQDQAITPPGRNCTVWSAVDEGIRYVPSGPGSLLKRVELYRNGTLIATDLSPTILGNGELEANFPNVCQGVDSMSYVVRAFYGHCNNPAIETEGSDTIIVYKDLPTIVTDLVDAPCNGNLGKITVVSPYSPPNVEYSIDGGTNWQTFNVFNVPAGTYTVLARSISNLCTGSKTVTITQPPAFAAFATTITSGTCGTNDGELNITATGGTLPYQYSLDGITWQPSNLFSNLWAGNYSVRARDAHNCMAIFPGIVPLNDTMRLDLGTDSTICFGTKITLIPQTNALTDTFKWTPAATLNSDTARNPIASPTDTTKYYLVAKWGVCTRRDSITVNVLHKPVITTGKDTTVCYKTNATLFGSASNLSGPVNFAWSPPDSLNTPNAPTTIARIDTTRQFTLTVTDNYGCNFSVIDSVTVFMQSLLVVFAGNDTNAILGRQHQLRATGNNATDFVWSPVTALDNPFIANPLATLYSNTWFYVHATDAIGCTDDDTVFIKVYEGPNYYLPNAFSPNGDGLNDVFFPTPVGISSTEYFRIFDRYGALVYQTREWMQGWDGKLKGKPAALGTYVWMIKGINVNGSVVEMKGTVILIR